jgi:hypothetical protein
LTTAITLSPALSWSSSALDRVIALSMRVVTNPHDNMSHGFPKTDFFNDAAQCVSG